MTIKNIALKEIEARSIKPVVADMNAQDAGKFVVGIFADNGIKIKVDKKAVDGTGENLIFSFKNPVTGEEEAFALNLNGNRVDFDSLGHDTFDPRMEYLADGPAAPDFSNIKKAKTVKEFEKWSDGLDKHRSYVEKALRNQAEFAENLFQAMKALYAAVLKNKVK